jgi:thioredoxin reductase
MIINGPAQDSADTDEMAPRYDVVVIGGGVAGLSGALTLARARRRIAVIDAGSPRNAPAAGVHNYLSRDGMSPLALLAQGRAEVRGYGGHLVAGQVTEVTRDGTGFTVTLAGGRATHARRLLVTTGLVDELPDVPGLRDRWGRDVVHCPYCHGWEIRDQAIGVLGTGPMSMHQALLFRQWSADITYLPHTTPLPAGEQAGQLAARGVTVVPGEVAGLEVTGDRLTGVRLRDGAVIAVQALAVASRMVARGELLAGLGLKPVAHQSGMGEYLPADPAGRTEVPGLWLAGNVADISAAVPGSVASGALAAAHLNADLVTEETDQAVAARSAGPGGRAPR